MKVAAPCIAQTSIEVAQKQPVFELVPWSLVVHMRLEDDCLRAGIRRSSNSTHYGARADSHEPHYNYRLSVWTVAWRPETLQCLYPIEQSPGDRSTDPHKYSTSSSRDQNCVRACFLMSPPPMYLRLTQHRFVLT
ncbi:hypothetical protein J1614_003785 [Plenodomus biglobosus]|nr:hypothetical protein J1614_003785 [Plenodomus biglobosus]